MLKRLSRDLFAGILFCAVGLAAVFVLIPIGVKVPESIKIAALSPDFWPTIIGWAAIVASVALIIESTWLKQPSLDDDDPVAEAEYDLETLPATLRILVLVVVLFGFYLSLTTFGMVVTSIILIAAMMLFFGERKYVMIGALSLGVPILLYLFFRYVANVPIPLGICGG